MARPIIIAGPTASGKSALALQIAKSVNGYIINADSRQIYSEVPISTAQPVPDSKNTGYWIIDGIKHFMYGVVQLDSEYNVHKFNSDIKEIVEVQKQVDENLVPIIVGGTGLYIDSYVYQYTLDSSERNNGISRDTLNEMSIDQLQARAGEHISSLNPSDKMNKRRLIRLIEKGNSKYEKGNSIECTYLYVDAKIEDLEEVFKERIRIMLNYGLEKEAMKIYKVYILKSIPIPKVIGIHEFIPYFEEKTSLESVVEEIYTHTRQYAKRQITWFKRNADIERVPFGSTEKMAKKALTIVKEGS